MDPFGGSFRIGRLFDIEIRVHFLFVIFIVWQLLQAGPDMQSALLFLSLLFGIVLLHEFGHCFGARAVGGQADQILMWPLGGLAYCMPPNRPWPVFVTVAAGPLVNVVFCIAAGILVYFHPEGKLYESNPAEWLFYNPLTSPIWRFENTSLFTLAVTFYQVNYLLLIFNLLPIYPLDGGRILHTIMWPFLGLRQATETAAYAGLAGAAVFVYLWLTAEQGYMLLFIAIFGGFASWQQLQAAKHGLLMEDNPRFQVIRPKKKRKRGWFGKLRGKQDDADAGPTYDLGHDNDYGPLHDPEPRETSHERSYEERLQAEVDRILKKVSNQGIASLTYAEKQTLERARRARER